MFRLELLDAAPEGWDPFVRAHPRGTPFHLAAWAQCVAYGLSAPARFLAAFEGADLVGTLPLHLVRSVFFGRRLVSSPQAAYGGPLAADGAVRAALVRRAVEEAERLGVDHLELRCEHPEAAAEGPRWHGSSLHVTFGGAIAEDDASILAAIPKRTRADCRKADALLVAEESPRHFERFRRLFAENQRDLGTPVLPTAFLRAVTEAPDLGARVLVVGRGDDAAAACLSLTYADRVLPYYAGAARSALPAHPNHALYLSVLRNARAAGARYFDFGRSRRGSGSYDFKRRWEFPERPLAYRYRLVAADAPPDVHPSNPRYRRRIDAWKRLPLWAANRVGPILSPGLP